jgi:hypothetical protein
VCAPVVGDGVGVVVGEALGTEGVFTPCSGTEQARCPTLCAEAMDAFSRGCRVKHKGSGVFGSVDAVFVGEGKLKVRRDDGTSFHKQPAANFEAVAADAKAPEPVEGPRKRKQLKPYDAPDERPPSQIARASGGLVTPSESPSTSNAPPPRLPIEPSEAATEARPGGSRLRDPSEFASEAMDGCLEQRSREAMPRCVLQFLMPLVSCAKFPSDFVKGLGLEKEIAKMSFDDKLWVDGPLAKFKGAVNVTERGCCIERAAIDAWWAAGHRNCATYLFACHLMNQTNAELCDIPHMDPAAVERIRSAAKMASARVRAVAWGNRERTEGLGTKEVSVSKVLFFTPPGAEAGASTPHSDGVGHGMDRIAVSWSARGEGAPTGDFYMYYIDYRT